eukprot:m.335986 g.335986  ORF g.335986 m.335986 type:complete len:57 (-) comp17728_c0_seq1:68-238(-)
MQGTFLQIHIHQESHSSMTMVVTTYCSKPCIRHDGELRTMKYVVFKPTRTPYCRIS